MKIRLFILLVLSTLGLGLAVSPGMAQQPIPGIKQTAAYQSLQKYASFLKVRRNQPATASRKTTYRRNLAQRRQRVDIKVKGLYRLTLTRIARKDDRWQRRQIKRIRRANKRQVRTLQGKQTSRINALQAKQAIAVQIIENRYAPKLNRLIDRRAKLRKKLAKTTKPAKRAEISRQIKRLQSRINDLAADRQDAIDDVNDRYSNRIAAVNELFNARIAKANAAAKRKIAQTDRAWRQTFRVQLKAAKTRRDAQKDLVRSLTQRGSGYIDSMPAPQP